MNHRKNDNRENHNFRVLLSIVWQKDLYIKYIPINATAADNNLNTKAIVKGLFTPNTLKNLKTSTTIAGCIADLIWYVYSHGRLAATVIFSFNPANSSIWKCSSK
jgi:hypothetical protein